MPSETRFSRWRRRHNMTQAQIAAKTGFTQRQVGNWDRGQVPYARNRDAVAKALGARVCDLFDVDKKRKAA